MRHRIPAGKAIKSPEMGILLSLDNSLCSYDWILGLITAGVVSSGTEVLDGRQAGGSKERAFKDE
jgi:hypothetical protein